jgi:hypothetical protein
MELSFQLRLAMQAAFGASRISGRHQAESKGFGQASMRFRSWRSIQVDEVLKSISVQ